MKALKIGGFFLAGAIIQVAFYLLEFLGIFAGYGGLMLVSFITTGLGVFLGCMAHKLAEKKMKMSPRCPNNVLCHGNTRDDCRVVY